MIIFSDRAEEVSRYGSQPPRLPAIAKGLGWLSLGIGLAELLAPGRVSRGIGVRNRPMVVRALGLREVITGIGLLTQRRRVRSWVRSRVAGDVMDLGLLGAAIVLGTRGAPNRLLAATGAVAGIAVLDWLSAGRMPGRREASDEFEQSEESDGTLVKRAITINRSPGEVYQFWRDLENVSNFMKHVQVVQTMDERRSHWIVEGPGGSRWEWDAEITEDEPDRRIAWRSLDDADVEHSGVVEFEPAAGNRGTVVRVCMEFRPSGALGKAAESFLRRLPERRLDRDLRRLRQLIETGELARTEGQPAGRRRSTSRIFDDLVRA